MTECRLAEETKDHEVLNSRTPEQHLCEPTLTYADEEGTVFRGNCRVPRTETLRKFEGVSPAQMQPGSGFPLQGRTRRFSSLGAFHCNPSRKPLCDSLAVRELWPTH